MYQFSYAETLDDDAHDARHREKQAFDHAITMLRAAAAHGLNSPQASNALFFLDEFWSILMEDLAHEESDLPENLRASLISIGLWVLKQTADIRAGTITTFDGLIEINQIIRDGLK